ncbi:MAG: hypothetical protein HRU20_24095, partial [Pseudomonadales bacterium]|nr:hypothetical protein [Pseudomonadales bacterium]
AAGSACIIWLNMVRHSEAGSSYVSSSGNIVNVPEEAFTPVDYLVRGQSRKHFYLKDSYSGYVRNDCGGNCSSGDSYADSTTENYEGSNKKLWLIQSYEEGMADFFIGSIDDTVWELADYIMVRSDRQSLEIDNVGETLQIEETPDPHNWPSGSTDGTIISITNGIFSIESRGDNHRPLQVFPRGSCPAPFCTRDQFYPYWD